MTMAPKSENLEEEELISRIEGYEEKRKKFIATILTSVFGVYILPFLTLIYLLGIIAFVIAPAMVVYYTWKKRELEEELKDIREEPDLDPEDLSL